MSRQASGAMRRRNDSGGNPRGNAEKQAASAAAATAAGETLPADSNGRERVGGDNQSLRISAAEGMETPAQN